MIDQDTLHEVFAIGERRRAERRRFLAAAGVAVGGSVLLAGCGSDDSTTNTLTGTDNGLTQSDNDILNYALNLE
jgi:hypothetical protein